MNGHWVRAREALQEVLSADDAERVTSKAVLSNIPKPLNSGGSYLNVRFPRTTVRKNLRRRGREWGGAAGRPFANNLRAGCR